MTHDASLPVPAGRTPVRVVVAEAVLSVAGRVPHSRRTRQRDPARHARSIVEAAARKAALGAGGLALPPGWLGWFTVLPEIVGIWRLQAQMVADIAAIHGKTAALTREQMLYCLFRHTAAQAVRDLVVRAGERYLVRRLSPAMLRAVAARIGVRVTQGAAGRSLSRWLPVIGAVGVGAYAYFDTTQVARTAIEVFGREIELEAENDSPGP